VLKLVDNTCKDSFDLFYGLFRYNKHSAEQIQVTTHTDTPLLG
jgi:hypothetical protein